MKKIIIILVVLGILGFGAYTYYKTKIANAATLAEGETTYTVEKTTLKWGSFRSPIHPLTWRLRFGLFLTALKPPEFSIHLCPRMLYNACLIHSGPNGFE
jgi:hypothetical protein